jgi:multiple sugar transport system permease protein
MYTGTTAMSGDIWPDQLLQMFDPTVSSVVGKIDIGPEPSQAGVQPANMTGTWLLGIPQGSKNRERAFDFMVWFTGFDQQKQLLLGFNNPPVLSPLFGDPEATAKFPFLPGLLAAAEKAVPRPRTPFYSGVEDIIGRYVSQAIAGQTSPERGAAVGTARRARLPGPQRSAVVSTAQLKKSDLRAPWWERNIQYLLPLPTVVLLVIFVIYPTITAIQFSLNHITITGEGLQMRFTGLDNFIRAFRDALIINAARITLQGVVVVTLFEILIGLALALVVSSGIRFRGLVISLLMIPIVLPPVSVSLAWRFSYQEQFGVYNYLLSLIGVGPVRWLSDRNIALYSVMLTDLWQATPFVFLLLLAGIQATPTDPFEAAAIDGATPWKIFRTITLPLLRPTLLVVVLLRTIDAARIFDKIYVMTNGGGPGIATETLTMSIYKTAFIQFDFGYAAALSFLFQLVLIVLGTLYVRRVLKEG